MLNKKQLVLILTGLAGSGKTTASAFFQRKNIPVVKMGEITQKLLQRKGLPITEENEDFIRTNLRKKKGENIYARLVVLEVFHKYKESPIVVIEGARSITELNYLKRQLPSVKVLFINVNKQTRYQRLLKRKVRPFTFEEIKKREAWEEILGVALLEKVADRVIKNHGTKSNFYEKLGKVLANVSFNYG